MQTKGRKKNCPILHQHAEQKPKSLLPPECRTDRES